jgi:hypothetical protein
LAHSITGTVGSDSSQNLGWSPGWEFGIVMKQVKRIFEKCSKDVISSNLLSSKTVDCMQILFISFKFYWHIRLAQQ